MTLGRFAMLLEDKIVSEHGDADVSRLAIMLCVVIDRAGIADLPMPDPVEFANRLKDERAR